jgi:hypothetical protein
MRSRLVLAVAALSAIAVTAPAALAGPAAPVMDGKKVKKLTLSAMTTAQSNDTILATEVVNGSERMSCDATKCAVLPFVYKPAKGVKGDVMFTINWATPGSDFDLYAVSIDKNGDRTQLGTCGGSVGQTEKVFLSSDNFKPGKTYALLAYFFRTPGEKLTGTVEMPGTNTIKSSVPADADEIALVNCTQ